MADSTLNGSAPIGAMQHQDAQTWGDGPNNNPDFSQYFGPSSGPIATNPYDKFGYTNFDLPDAYKGRNMFLRDTIDGFIMEDTSWYTSAALPYVKTNEHHFVWNEWHFDTPLVGMVPEEGVSRLIRSSKRSFKESTVRRGIAFQLEHGFMNTPEGRDQYVMNLRQIQQSVQETANHDVIAALLNCRRYDREWEKKHGVLNRPFAQLMRREVNQWGIVQKNPNGLDRMHEEYKQRLGRWKVTPDMWIFPPKLCLYLTMVPPEKTRYSEVGPEGPAKFNAGPSALTHFRGVRVFETREFDIYDGDLPIDLLRRQQQIGEFNVMGDPWRHATKDDVAKGYKSEHRDIIIYNEEQDNWSRIGFTEALKNADDRPGFADDGRWEGYEAKAPDDDMYYNNATGTDETRIKFFGQMDDKFLSNSSIERVAACLKHTHKAYNHEKGKLMKVQSLMSVMKYDPNANVPMFKKASGGVSALDPVLVAEHVVALNVDSTGTFVTDMAARLTDPGDKQRFLHGLTNALASKTDLKSHKNLYKAMTKRAPKGTEEVRGYLVSSPFWDASLDPSTVAAGDGWESTNEVWDPKYANDPNWRAGDPATNYTTASKVAYTPGGNTWDDTPWAIAARATSAQSRHHEAARPSRGSDFSRYDADAMDDILGMGAGAKFARVGGQRDRVHLHDALESKLPSCSSGDTDHDLVQELNDTNNKALIKRFNEFKDNAWAQWFLCLTATNKNLAALAENNIWIPFNIVLLRPHMTYEMCSAVLMKGGMETGMTAVGHNDFQLGDNVADKMHYGNYTFKSKAFVQQPRNVIIAENIFAQGYVQGNGVKMVSRSAYTNPDNSEDAGCMHVWVVPYDNNGKAEYQSPMDLTGRFANSSSDLHIHGAGHYHGAWASRRDVRENTDRFAADGTVFTENQMDRLNTVCYHGHQFSYNRHSGSHDVVKRNTGHWGPNVYPGCGVVRNGEQQNFREMNYVDCPQ